jgi:hypothetical protein
MRCPEAYEGYAMSPQAAKQGGAADAECTGDGAGSAAVLSTQVAKCLGAALTLGLPFAVADDVRF